MKELEAVEVPQISAWKELLGRFPILERSLGFLDGKVRPSLLSNV
jgi:hypothetical protein